MNSVKEGKSESSLYRVSYIMNTLIKKIKVKKMAQFIEFESWQRQLLAGLKLTML